MKRFKTYIINIINYILKDIIYILIIFDKMCKENGCKIYACFNFVNEKKKLYCSQHKLDGMVNVRDKTCIYLDCKVIPGFNLEGESKALYCSSHKLDGMVDVKHKTCIYLNCKVRANFNVEGKYKSIVLF